MNLEASLFLKAEVQIAFALKIEMTHARRDLALWNRLKLRKNVEICPLILGRGFFCQTKEDFRSLYSLGDLRYLNVTSLIIDKPHKSF